MKHILIILLSIVSVTVYSQSPRIKLNQIVKDNAVGSVLISSPTDSQMVYSRDFFINFGADTTLVLFGDTIGGGISTVVADLLTIQGDGSVATPLYVDTSVINTIQGMIDTLTARGYLTSEVDGSTTNEIQTLSKVGQTVSLSLSGGSFTDDVLTETEVDAFVANNGYLTAEVDGSTTNELQTISTDNTPGNITLSNSGGTLTLNVNDADASATNEIQTISKAAQTVTLSDGGGSFTDDVLSEAQVDSYVSNNGYLTSEVDGDISNEGLLTVGYGTSTSVPINSNTSGSNAVNIEAGTNITLLGDPTTNSVIIGSTGGGTTYNNISETADTVYIDKFLNVDTSTLYVDATNNRVGIGTTNPGVPLEVNGNGRFTGLSIGTYNSSNTPVDLKFNSSSPQLFRFWNEGTGGAKMRFISDDNAEASHQWTVSSAWLAQIAAGYDGTNENNNYIDFRVRGASDAGTEAGLEAATKLTIKGNGNVGIGTSSPSGVLHTVATSASDVPIFQRNGSGDVMVTKMANYYGGNVGAQFGFEMKNSSNSNVFAGFFGFGVTNSTAGSETSDIFFRPYNSGVANEGLRIKGNGNVGIGTSSPSAKLDVTKLTEGEVARFRGSSASRFFKIESFTNFFSEGAGFRFNTSSTAGAFQFAITDDVKMHIDREGNVGIGTISPSVQLELSTDGAKKLTTTTWQTGSDRRIKKNIVPYTKGLTEILRLEPIEYELNGKANTIDGAKGVGLIAQEVQPIVPEAVISYQGKLNETDENLTNLYNITTHPFFFMFINGFKEQQSIIETQEQKITDLESTIHSLIKRIENLENK